jgi:predicted metal-dependent hydrolase
MIEYIQANNRNQLEFYCNEEVIEAEHPARFIYNKKEWLQNRLRSTPSRMKKPLTRGAF